VCTACACPPHSFAGRHCRGAARQIRQPEDRCHHSRGESRQFFAGALHPTVFMSTFELFVSRRCLCLATCWIRVYVALLPFATSDKDSGYVIHFSLLFSSSPPGSSRHVMNADTSACFADSGRAFFPVSENGRLPRVPCQLQMSIQRERR